MTFKLLLFLVALVSACSAEDCFCNVGNETEGRELALRPLDPFLQVGVPSRICCHVVQVEPDGLKDVNVVWPEDPPEFFCLAATVDVSPVFEARFDNGPGDNSSFTAQCANLTVTTGGKSMACFCRVQRQDDCNCKASQQATVDVSLPSTLEFSCINFNNENVICSLHVPEFHYSEFANASIRYIQVDKETGRILKSKESIEPCSDYRACHPKIGFLGLGLHYNISVVLTYDPCRRQNQNIERICPQPESVTITSGWQTFDSSARLQLKPLVPSVIVTTARSFTVAWEQIPLFSTAKVINISYVEHSGEIPKLKEFKEASFGQPKTILQGLVPYTLYTICLTARPENSVLWSENKCTEARTGEDVPEKSPITSPDAFTIIDSSTYIVYWKPLDESDWNGPTQKGSYILQKFNASSIWEDMNRLAWADVQARVEMDDLEKLRVIAANDIGRSQSGSDITIPDADERIPVPEEISATLETSKGLVNITWASKTKRRAAVFWCEQGPQRLTCLNSIAWNNVTNGRSWYSVPVTNFTEARMSMYGVAVSRVEGGAVLRSGIKWQTCMRVIDGDSTSLQGNCKSTETVGTSTFPAYGIALIAVFVVIAVALSIVIVKHIVRIRKKKLSHLWDYQDAFPSEECFANPSHIPPDCPTTAVPERNGHGPLYSALTNESSSPDTSDGQEFEFPNGHVNIDNNHGYEKVLFPPLRGSSASGDISEGDGIQLEERGGDRNVNREVNISENDSMECSGGIELNMGNEIPAENEGFGDEGDEREEDSSGVESNVSRDYASTGLVLDLKKPTEASSTEPLPTCVQVGDENYSSDEELDGSTNDIIDNEDHIDETDNDIGSSDDYSTRSRGIRLQPVAQSVDPMEQRVSMYVQVAKDEDEVDSSLGEGSSSSDRDNTADSEGQQSSSGSCDSVLQKSENDSKVGKVQVEDVTSDKISSVISI